MSDAVATSVPRASVSVSAFDVHLWSKPFDPAVFDPKIHFLWSASDYRKMIDAGQKIELANLVLFPLKPENNRLWKRYEIAVDNLPAGSPTRLGDGRDFLRPLRCRPKKFALTFAGGKTPVKVWATIWLWPFGWSSTVEFKVATPYSLAELQNVGMKLRGTAPPPFLLDGKPTPLSGVFKKLADLVCDNVALPGKAPDHAMRLGRHVVFALELPRGKPVPANADGWSAADQQRMLGTLRGDKVDLDKLLNSGVLYTPLGEGSFAVTDFDQGTLLMLRDWRDRYGKSRETNHCLFANVRSFSMAFLALHQFIQYAKTRPEIAGAVDNAKLLLEALPKEYSNAVGGRFKNYFAAA
jgi:hypothetical protein